MNYLSLHVGEYSYSLHEILIIINKNETQMYIKSQDLESTDIFCRICEQKLFGITEIMQAQIEALIQTITMNIGYPMLIENLGVLLDYTFYFDICALIFPQINIKIIKIGEDQSLAPSKKIQKLLELLTEELQINLAALSGNEILKGHFIHVYQFLKVLKQFSELPIQRLAVPKGKLNRKVHSCPSLYQLQINTKQPQSARDDIKERNLQIEREQLNNLMNKEQMLHQEDKKEQLLNSNQYIEQQILNLCENQKQKKQILIPSKFKSKKIKNTKKTFKKLEHKTVSGKLNKKYKSYLQNLMKRNQKEKKQKDKLKNLIRPKSANHSSWKKEIKEIDDFFHVFQLKLRDQKHKYLRKMQQIIREQQNERMRVKQKLTIEKSKKNEKEQIKIINSLMQTHTNKKNILHQRAQSNKQQITTIKREHSKHLRSSIKQLKVRKQQQLNKIKSYITQLNNKILTKLQDGGELQKFVFNLYKKL